MSMADAEAVVNTELVVCDGEDASMSAKEREHEELEVPEEEPQDASIEIAEVQDHPDSKRKLEDMEPDNKDESPAKKQKLCGSDDSTEVPVPTTDQVTAASEVAAPEIENQETDGPGLPGMETPASVADDTIPDSAHDTSASVADDTIPDSAHDIPAIDGNIEQQPRQDKEPDGIGLKHVMVEEQSFGNGQIPSTESIQHPSANDTQHPSTAHTPDDIPLPMHTSSYDVSSSALLKIDVPNDKVGVLIGKHGETIKNLQMNSGAKIQIARDTDVDPFSSTRIVELIGTLECVTKAEQLIKDVIAEADAGGSPALVARGFGALQSGDEQSEIQVPNEKVGMIIGKGGEAIKNIQTKSGARVQLIPQHLPKGDASKERTVRITGNKKQLETAKEMIKDILNQIPRTSNTFRPPRGPGPMTNSGPRSAAPTQQTSNYNHQQRGMYPQTQYPQPYGGYSQQAPPRGSYGSNWVQPRPAAPPLQASPQPGSYDYYNQGAPVHNNQPPNSVPGSGPASTSPPTSYNYYQSQPPDAYGHSAPYGQPPSAQPQKYAHGYSNEAKYDTQPSGQQTYAQPQQPMGPQPGIYGPQSSTPYVQQAYGAHDMNRTAQPGDQMYQGAPQNQYPSSAPTQQQYPYTSSAPVQQAPPSYNQQTYGPTSTPADGYSQQAAAGYGQPAPAYGQPAPAYGQPAPAYGQPTPAYGQPAPAYGQPVPQTASYSQYPSSQQPSYVDQSVQANVNYGYQGAAPDAAYAGSMPNSVYTSQPPVAVQPGYSQAPPNPQGYYDQSMPTQSGYAAPITAPVAASVAAPVAFAKSVSPQPGYGGQYDSGQTYAHH